MEFQFLNSSKSNVTIMRLSKEFNRNSTIDTMLCTQRRQIPTVKEEIETINLQYVERFRITIIS